MKKLTILAEGAAMLCMTGALALTAANTGPASDEGQAENYGIGGVETAGIASVLNDYKLTLAEEQEDMITIEKEHVDIVTSAGLSADVFRNEEEMAEGAGEAKEQEARSDEGKSENKEEVPELTEEELAWQDYLMADVHEYLNIRAGKSEDSEIVAKLRKGDRALIKEAGKEWTKIASGSAVGYVKNEYCVMGTAALTYARKHCDRIATVTSDGLRVRKGQSTESSIVRRMDEGEVLTVDTSAKTKKGWIAVLLDSKTCYVSADYVALSYRTGKAVTIEEEKAAQEAAAAAEKAEAEAKAEQSSSNQTTAASTTQGHSLAANADEVTLLAALIQCEAGGQSYECQLAVGAVVVNRIRSGRFPSSMYQVIYQRGQFGPAATGKLERRLQSGVSSTALRAAEAALSGTDNTGGSLFFNLKSSGHAGTVIGAIVFY